MVLSAPGPELLEDRLRQDWVFDLLTQLTAGNDDLLYLRLLQSDGTGPMVGPEHTAEGVEAAFTAAFQQATAEEGPIYRFVDLAPGHQPAVIVALPVAVPDVGRLLILGLVSLPIGGAGTFADGRVEEDVLLF
jgi:hypothetical protein